MCMVTSVQLMIRDMAGADVSYALQIKLQISFLSSHFFNVCRTGVRMYVIEGAQINDSYWQ